MKKYVVCGDCGRKLCKAEPGSVTELSSEDKTYFDEYIQKPYREPSNSPWDTVEECTVIAPGIYSVSTAGHGGIMIDRALAPHILSSEALAEGFVENGCYCYEEDAAESIPLRELYNKGILNKTNEYFTRLEYVSTDPDAEDEYIRFGERLARESRGNVVFKQPLVFSESDRLCCFFFNGQPVFCKVVEEYGVPAFCFYAAGCGIVVERVNEFLF